MPERITNNELRALVDNEIREAMGELSGELADERSRAMDYYHGEPTGKLAQPNSDRSSAVLTTVRDTVEWIMPEMMRVFAKADKIVEFEPIGQEDEEAAEQETQALNHIFWRQNQGFLVLYSWFKDAMLQKNGIVKWWLDESEPRSREEYDGITPVKLAELQRDPELEALEYEPSKIKSVDGTPLHHVVYQRRKKRCRIVVECIPPEEFLISPDCRSISIAEGKPRFVGHYTEKTRTELKEMGFNDAAIEKMARGGGEFVEEWDEEYYARYRLTDEQTHLHGSEPHESQVKIKLVEGYMRLDENGDGYAELLQIWRAGDYCESEECDQIPFAALTPNILTHKFIGMSIADLVSDLQEIASTVLRNMLDNMYHTNNVRPAINDRVDLDSLLDSRPGAPIVVEGEMAVGDSVAPFAPPPMWKDGLQYLEWQDGVRKDRTGVGDEVMGLDPQTLSNANTGVVLQAYEAARSKIELIARIFAETGVRWLFQGMHELARKSYDQPLRYKLRNQYAEVRPQEWQERTDMVVHVGTATGSEQREFAALSEVQNIQAGMIQAGGLGLTVLPSQVYEAAVDKIEAMGKKDAEKYFFDPRLLANQQVQQMVQAQLPQQQDPSAGMIQAQMQIEGNKAQVEVQKAMLQARLKEAELMLKREEMMAKAEVEQMKQEMQNLRDAAKNQVAEEKMALEGVADRLDANLKTIELAMKDRQEQQQNTIDQYRAELQSYTTLETKRMDIIQKDHEEMMALAQGRLDSAKEAEKKAAETATQIHEKAKADQTQLLDRIGQDIAALRDEIMRPKDIERNESGQIVAIGGRRVRYSDKGELQGIG